MNPIGWCTDTWNPVTGCSPVSPACDHCYANRMATRLAGRFGYPADDPFRVTFHPDRLEEPLKWKKPRRVFVCSMGDLFHEDVDMDWFLRIFRAMWEAPQHTYLLLTKRPECMREWVDWTVRHAWQCDGNSTLGPHIWLGVTVENQQRACERIPALCKTPAAHRYVSLEPLLDRVELTKRADASLPYGEGYETSWLCNIPGMERIEWVIAGAETGPGARAADPDWFRSLRDQCHGHIPFYLKDKPGTIDGVQYREIPEGMAS